MIPTGDDGGDAAVWDDALRAAACVAVDPLGLGGVRVRSAAGPVRDAWLERWRALVPSSAPIRNVPLHIDDGRLIGGLDLAASLRAGRAIEQPGLLAQVDGGYGVLAMAERVDPSTAARIASVLETGATSRGARTRFGVIALDEGEGDEALAASLGERLALHIDLRRCSMRTVSRAMTTIDAAAVAGARERSKAVVVGDDAVGALCAAAFAVGIDSLRMPLFAVRVARILAALDGRAIVDGDDAAHAARLVFASRARRLPRAPSSAEADEGRSDEAEAGAPDAPAEVDRRDAFDDAPVDRSPTEPEDGGGTLDETVLEATAAAIPAGLLASLAGGAVPQRATPARASGAGATSGGGQRGAPAGTRRGRPRARERLDLIATLRAAAPWQRVRRGEPRVGDGPGARVQVRAEDLHVVRFRQRRSTTTVFVVDASGSAALHRLAEAKGAVELLLADCYVRRDSVAVLAFRGTTTELLLPPTRSLVRARRSLAGLPGGGGTPLASALDATRELVTTLRRRGDTALAIFLTDGRANVARDGSGGRPRAEADALASARALRALAVDAVLIDTSPQPAAQAVRLADAMGASYRALPHADARAMSAVVNRAANLRSAAAS